MADFPKLLTAAQQAYDAEAWDLTADFLQRALAEVRPQASRPRGSLPWSTVPTDERHGEFRRRAIRFLRHFARHARGELAEAEAKAVARRVFPEQPRIVGPSFYRPGLIEAADSRTIGPVVRITPAGRRFLSSLEQSEREEQNSNANANAHAEPATA